MISLRCVETDTKMCVSAISVRHVSAASMIEYNVQQCHCVHVLAARARLT